MSYQSSSAFHLIDERIQRFIWAEGWESLRDAQEATIPLIIKADRDVIVAAATAAGKTEAAFLPALTHLVQSDPPGLIVYISPLKALINDQFGRLDRLCEQLEVPVWPWHGDISASTKTRFLAKRQGVLLITPESLEALLCNRGTSVGAAFERLTFFVVDELHAFIGAERGKQLQSLMHRIECVIGRTVPRIGLSATLGDMSLAAEFLRPGKGSAVALVESKASGSELKILVKGYEEPLVVEVKPTRAGTRAGASASAGSDEDADADASADTEEDDEDEPVTPAQIAAHMFKSLRGANNLVFPNSRREVERFTHLLNKLCEQRQVPNEFWPHHGSLSKEIRAETEAALKQKEHPATAICTNTLELGIDIGAVKSVCQVGPPPSVASLRQRLGRSGRRKGEPAILRGYCVEDAIGPRASLDTELRLGTLQMAAMISLLLEGWFEPPRANGAHLSTLVQQMLSFIAQNGGATIGQLYGLLCAPGTPFSGVSKDEFVELVRHLGQKELLVQESSGLLLHGRVGEKFVNHYSFYAAFSADEEFRIVSRGRPLGTLPVSQMLVVGQRILFAGKTWRVEEIDEEQKTIFVVRSGGGAPPLFSGGAGRTHTRVRQRMRELLESNAAPPAYLDDVAKRFLADARDNYAARNLASEFLVDEGPQVFLLTWLGDAANEALACLLIRRGFTATAGGPGVEVRKNGHSAEDVLDVLADAAIDEAPPLDLLLTDIRNLQREKWDWALPDALLRKAYASLYLDLDEALEWVRTLPGAGDAKW
jgi:ATP-dependent Lhr-like helicase